MKKMVKRTMSVILALAVVVTMLAGMTTVTMAAESTGNFLWIESANMVRDGGGFGTVSNASVASGGSVVVNWNTQGGLTANFTVAEGTYDIWFLGQRVAAWASTLNWEIDGGDAQGKYAQSNYAAVGTVDAAYPENYWHKLNSQVYFTEGSHSLRIGAVAKSTSTNKFIQLYDAVVIVPSEMLWKPSGLTKPTKGQIAGGYTYIEGANFTYADRHGIASQTGADRGTVAKFYNSSDAEFVSAKINYDFMVDETAEYDIWVLGSQSVAWLGEYKWKLDDGESYNGFGTALRNPYNWTVTGGDQGVYVYKVGSGETITAGKHNLEFELKKRTAGNGSFNLIDTIMVVPTSANWEWKLGDGITAAMLSLDKATLAIDASGEVKENFTLPIYGQSGSKIAWTSNNGAITINGQNAVVTRPGELEADAEVTLTATITRDGSSTTKTFAVTVPKTTLYEINEFDFKYSDGTEIGETVTAGNTVVATADVTYNGTETLTNPAVLILAGYDVNGVLKYIDFDFENPADLELSYTVEAGITRVSAMLWNGLDNMFPITNAVTKGN